MTKSDWTRDQIDEGQSYNNPRQPTYVNGRNINAFDTETHDGTVFMLSYAFDDGVGFDSGHYANEEVEQLNPELIFNTLTSGRCRQAVNVWFNMGFDADAILGSVLNDEALGILKGVDEVNAVFIPEDAKFETYENVEYENRHGTTKEAALAYKVTFENDEGEVDSKNFHLETESDVRNHAVIRTESLNAKYEISYLDGKLLVMTDEHGHTYRHYDVAQFFFTSLEKATEEWLPNNQQKLDTVDTSKFGSTPCGKNGHEDHAVEDCEECWTSEDAIEYIQDEWETIVEYAEVDAEVTQQLAEEFIELGEDLGIPMGSPISTGYIAEEYMRARAWIDAHAEVLDDYELTEEQQVIVDEATEEYGNNHLEQMKEMVKEVVDYEVYYEQGERKTKNKEALDELRNEVKTLVVKSGHAPKAVERDLWDSYKGGRFEVFERGNAGRVAAPDINSAYPAVLKELPDPRTLDWFYIEDATVEDLAEYDFGVVRAEVTTDSSRRIQPFAVKDFADGGKVKYPALEDREVTTIKEIFEHAHEQDLLEDYEIERAWVAQETEATTYRFDWLSDMYDERNKFKARGKDKTQMLLKIIINSVYGKLCQTTWKPKLLTESDLEDYEEEHGEAYQMASNEKMLDTNYLSEPIREYVGDDILMAELQAGSWWNPFYATYITGMTRLELHKRTLEYGLEEDTVMFATDCVMYDFEAYNNSDFGDDLFVDGELGMWDDDYGIDEPAHATVYGSGVYEVEFIELTPDRLNWDKKPDDMTRVDYYLNKRFKTKTRGFPEAILEPTMRKMGYDNPEGIPLEIGRPLSLTESLMNPDLNASEFIQQKRNIRPDFDTKRDWENDSPTFVDLIEDNEVGDPLVLEATEDESDWMSEVMDGEKEEMMEEVEVVNDDNDEDKKTAEDLAEEWFGE